MSGPGLDPERRDAGHGFSWMAAPLESAHFLC